MIRTRYVFRYGQHLQRRSSGQLKRENVFFSCPRWHLTIWSRETGSAVPSRVSLLISILILNLVLTYGIPPDSAAASIYLYRRVRHRVSPEFIKSHNCVPMAFITECLPAQGQ